MIPGVGFSCPSCGSREHFSPFKALSRVARKKCGGCGVEIESQPGSGRYVLLLVYIHVVLALTGVPFVLAMAGGRWGIALAAAAVFFGLALPPAMMLHARHAVVPGPGGTDMAGNA